jgi:hypothetical protein
MIKFLSIKMKEILLQQRSENDCWRRDRSKIEIQELFRLITYGLMLFNLS